MPAILHQAYKNRNVTPEFVGFQYLSKYLNIPTSKLKSSRMFDDVPFRYNENGMKMFRFTAAMDAVAKYRITPPDNLHPRHEFTQAEAMLELKFKPGQYIRFVKSGKLRTHKSEKTGKTVVYRRDIERFYREWYPYYLIMQMTAPVRRSVAAMLMGISIKRLKILTKEGKIHHEPRERRQPYKYSKSAMLAYLNPDRIGRRWFRKTPLPESVPAEIAAIYMGWTNSYFRKMREYHEVKPTPETKDAHTYLYSRADLDNLIDSHNDRVYYCEGYTYYTRRAIQYKFLKSERWIDEFISGKCRYVLNDGSIAPPTAKPGMVIRGWVKADVEKVVAKGVECKIRKKQPMKLYVRTGCSKAALATPPVIFANPVEQMEAAIAASIQEREAEKQKKSRAVLDKVNREYEQLNAIRNILSSGPEVRRTVPTRNDILRLSEERQIVTFLFSSDGLHGRYDEYPNVKDECVFRMTCGKVYGRRKIPPSFARAINNAIVKFKSLSVRFTPKWVIIASSTSFISDPMFHKCLDEVPAEVGAVAPFGYEYRLADGSWIGCPNTYGFYGLYSEITGEHRRVFGTRAIDGMHPVQVMDGPFVALRGEYLRELGYISFFQQLGDQRGLLGPSVSALCLKFSIPMMQIPVESWGSLEYVVRPRTPEMNLGVERIANFIKKPLGSLKDV